MGRVWPVTNLAVDKLSMSLGKLEYSVCKMCQLMCVIQVKVF